MKQISELQETLTYFLNWNKARLVCLIQILQALFLVRTVNLTQVAEAFQGPAKDQSSYRRIQRFFKDFSFDMSFIAILACKLFTWGEPCMLMLDRTQWKWGKSHINILMLSIEHLGIGIPVFWTVLDTGGNSSTRDRVKVLKKIIKAIGKNKIRVLLADREFIGEAWFRFLIEEGIPFVIRVKQNFMVEGICTTCTVPIGTLARNLGRKRKFNNHKVVLWKHRLFASVQWAKGAKEPIIVVSNREFEAPVELYLWRWGIETLFCCLKSRGFRLEETHMVDPLKIEKLLFVLAIAVCWAYKIGELKCRKVAIAIKNHGRKERSIFRVGLNLIRKVLFKGTEVPLEGLSVFPYLGIVIEGVSL